jgi:hypothetical protein
MKAIITKTKGSKLIAVVACVAIVLSLSVSALAAYESQNKPHVVTQEEYDAIQRGEIQLDDGVKRLVDNPYSPDGVYWVPADGATAEDKATDGGVYAPGSYVVPADNGLADDKASQ